MDVFATISLDLVSMETNYHTTLLLIQEKTYDFWNQIPVFLTLLLH
jgi:hypothetical protein